MTPRFKHLLLPIALLGAGCAMAYDFVVVDTPATMRRGFIGGDVEVVNLSPPLPSLPLKVEVAPGGGSLAALVGNRIYLIGGSTGSVQLTAVLPSTPSDFVVYNNTDFILTAQGITDLSGRIIIPTAILPAGATRFAV